MYDVWAATLSAKLDAAAALIDSAERKYDLRAPDGFWDAVEQAVESLVGISEQLRFFARAGRNYHRSLEGQRHNFPPFTVVLHSFRDPEPIVAALADVTRRGLGDSTLASIWNQRKNRDVRLGPFRTIDDALANEGRLMWHSYLDVMSSGAADAAVEPRG